MEEEEGKTQDPDFWNDPEAAEKQLKKVAGIKYWITVCDEIASAADDLQLMPDFVKEGLASADELDALYASTLEKIEARRTIWAPSWRSTPAQAVPKASTGLRCC